jgi:hypothetical protein
MATAKQIRANCQAALQQSLALQDLVLHRDTVEGLTEQEAGEVAGGLQFRTPISLGITRCSCITTLVLR